MEDVLAKQAKKMAFLNNGTISIKVHNHHVLALIDMKLIERYLFEVRFSLPKKPKSGLELTTFYYIS